MTVLPMRLTPACLPVTSGLPRERTHKTFTVMQLPWHPQTSTCSILVVRVAPSSLKTPRALPVATPVESLLTFQIALNWAQHVRALDVPTLRLVMWSSVAAAIDTLNTTHVSMALISTRWTHLSDWQVTHADTKVIWVQLQWRQVPCVPVPFPVPQVTFQTRWSMNHLMWMALSLSFIQSLLLVYPMDSLFCLPSKVHSPATVWQSLTKAPLHLKMSGLSKVEEEASLSHGHQSGELSRLMDCDRSVYEVIMCLYMIVA